MRRRLRRFQSPRLVIAGVVFSSVVSAQFGTENVADKDVGRPPRAPLMTFLGIVTSERMITDESLPLNGPVSEVLYEEVRAQRTPAAPAGEVITSIRTKYDEAGRTIEEIRKQWNSETTTVSRYEGMRLVSQETTLLNSKRAQSKFWNYWQFDQAGKLIEYRRGKDDQIQNHDTNFKRDGQGRLTSFEYRQGTKDELFSRTEFQYSSDGKTIDSTQYDAVGEAVYSTTENVDEQGRVAWVVIRERDWKTKKPKAPLKVAFTYDLKGRLLEQNTDLHEFEASGSENELPPGKISITYDDVKRTKRIAYPSNEGVLTFTTTHDARGATVAMSGGTSDMNLDVKLECVYDDHENWTSCASVSKTSGGNASEKLWRRTITYR